MGDVSRNFDRSDFLCRCAVCAVDPTVLPCTKTEVINALQDMRDLFGQPLVVDRGVSSKTHNAAIGGSSDSRHLPQHADAIDLACNSSEQAYRIVRSCILLGKFTFIEVSPKHIHLDMRPGDKRLITGPDK